MDANVVSTPVANSVANPVTNPVTNPDPVGQSINFYRILNLLNFKLFVQDLQYTLYAVYKILATKHADDSDKNDNA
jgi:hypothetical protein